LRTLLATVAQGADSAKAKAPVLTLASGSFAVPAGEAKTVTLRLSLRARALLARVGALRVRVTIAAHDPAGATHTITTVATLRLAKGKQGKG
jgi:hypothetical protein